MSKFYKLRVDLKLYLKDHNCILKQDSSEDHPLDTLHTRTSSISVKKVMKVRIRV